MPVVCDYCGCRRSGPTMELYEEHLRLLDLGDAIDNALHEGTDPTALFDEFTRLLFMHAAKEEIGLFVIASENDKLAEQVKVFCKEHEDLHLWLSDGPQGPRVPDALRLLITHIDDEEHDLFPHVFHDLDPDQADEIELAHRAIEAVWDDPTNPTHPDAAT